MGIKMTLDSVNTTRLTYTKNVSNAQHAQAVVAGLAENLFILPTFSIVPSNGAPLSEIQVPVLDANNVQVKTLVLDPFTLEPLEDPFTGEPTGELELVFEALASTYDFELFVNNGDQNKIAKIGKIPGQTPPGQTPDQYGYYYIEWDNWDVSSRFLKTMDNGAMQNGNCIIRWVPGEGLESQIEFWDNIEDITNEGFGTVAGLGGRAPDAVYWTLDRVAGPSVWYLPAEYPSQYSFGRHLQCELGGDVRLLGTHHGT
jgi:hypothetical protein